MESAYHVRGGRVDAPLLEEVAALVEVRGYPFSGTTRDAEAEQEREALAGGDGAPSNDELAYDSVKRLT